MAIFNSYVKLPEGNHPGSEKEKKKPARLNALESRIKGPGLGPQLWQPIDPYELWSILGIMNH